MGLRELKKEQTRQLIADTAWRMFSERGFDQVTVAEVAREAQVAEATVFNYFATKEDLFYWRLEAFGTRLVDAVSTRDPGESVLAAFWRALTTGGGLLDAAETGDPEAVFRLHVVNSMIASSPALLAREQQAINRIANALAALLTAEGADDFEAYVVANALLGVHRALLDYTRRRGTGRPRRAQRGPVSRPRAAVAFGLLARGLGDYAVRA
jgi:AcrR family transcriptional regulator